MLHRTVIPHEQVVHLPAMDVPELQIDDAVGQFIDQLKRFILRHALYTFALALAHIEAFPPVYG